LAPKNPKRAWLHVNAQDNGIFPRKIIPLVHSLEKELAAQPWQVRGPLAEERAPEDRGRKQRLDGQRAEQGKARASNVANTGTVGVLRGQRAAPQNDEGLGV
jgi:hypothetical protein